MCAFLAMHSRDDHSGVQWLTESTHLINAMDVLKGEITHDWCASAKAASQKLLYQPVLISR